VGVAGGHPGVVRPQSENLKILSTLDIEIEVQYADSRPTNSSCISIGNRDIRTRSHTFSRQIFCIGTVAAYSAKCSASVAYKIVEMFQY